MELLPLKCWAPGEHLSKFSKRFSLVALDWMLLAPGGDIWQCLQTFLVVRTAEGVLLASSGRAQGCC